jgi:hypothetical protein
LHRYREPNRETVKPKRRCTERVGLLLRDQEVPGSIINRRPTASGLARQNKTRRLSMTAITRLEYMEDLKVWLW